jgi:hypothetical protein
MTFLAIKITIISKYKKRYKMLSMRRVKKQYYLWNRRSKFIEQDEFYVGIIFYENGKIHFSTLKQYCQSFKM